MRSASTPEMAGIQQRLAAVRAATGLGPSQFAHWLGVTSQRWSNYEHSNRVPDWKVLTILYDKCGINMNWLLFGNGPALRPDDARARIHSKLG